MQKWTHIAEVKKTRKWNNAVLVECKGGRIRASFTTEQRPDLVIQGRGNTYTEAIDKIRKDVLAIADGMPYTRGLYANILREVEGVCEDDDLRLQVWGVRFQAENPWIMMGLCSLVDILKISRPAAVLDTLSPEKVCKHTNAAEALASLTGLVELTAQEERKLTEDDPA